MKRFDSNKYWIERYKNGGNSGVGSYGILGEFKSVILNEFIEKYKIKTICELGCGEGEHLANINIDYLGYDISEFIIKKNKILFPRLKFTSNSEINNNFDLTLSMDVILHLIEDDVYNSYMVKLFSLSKKYVIIYDANSDVNNNMNSHNKYRKFIKDVPNNFELFEVIQNPYKGINTQADFYFFIKK